MNWISRVVLDIEKDSTVIIYIIFNELKKKNIESFVVDPSSIKRWIPYWNTKDYYNNNFQWSNTLS